MYPITTLILKSRNHTASSHFRPLRHAGDLAWAKSDKQVVPKRTDQPSFSMMITNGGHDNNISTSRKGKREDGNEHPIRLFSKHLNKDYSNKHSIARTN